MLTKTTEVKETFKWNCCGSTSKVKHLVSTLKFLGIIIKTTIKEI